MKRYRILLYTGALFLLLLLCVLFRDIARTPESVASSAPQADSLVQTVLQDQTVTQVQTISQNQILSSAPAAPKQEAAVPVEPQTKTSAESENEAMTSEITGRVIYQPSFYYEPISEDVKSRIYGLSYKEDCTVPYEDLRYLSILYMTFDNTTATGEIICNKEIAADLVEIFYELYQAGYQIDKIRLIDEYMADDTVSITDNNTSCFNYRVVDGTTKLSKHALGLAIDINPFYNPYVTYPNGGIRISPIGSEAYADRKQDFPHKIDKSDLCYQLFTERGFTWGGAWKSLKDYQHFEKAIPKK